MDAGTKDLGHTFCLLLPGTVNNDGGQAAVSGILQQLHKGLFLVLHTGDSDDEVVRKSSAPYDILFCNVQVARHRGCCGLRGSGSDGQDAGHTKTLFKYLVQAQVGGSEVMAP